MATKARPRIAWPSSSVAREPRSCDQPGRAGRHEDHEDDGRQDGRARLERVVAEHVLEVLLVDEGDAHQRAEDDDAGDRGHPERLARGDLEVVERVGCAPLADDEERQHDDRQDEQADRERLHVGHRDEVERHDERADHDRGEDAAEVVHRLGRLVDVGGDVAPGHVEGEERERDRDEEDRAPGEELEQQAGDERPEHGVPPPRADQAAMERVRAGPLPRGP